MKTFNLIQAAISHIAKDPHSKALEPDGLSPLSASMTQSLWGEVGTTRNQERVRGVCINLKSCGSVCYF